MRVFSKISYGSDCNSYFIPEKKLLIDPGLHSKKEWLAQINFKKEDVSNILLTHCHYDHVATADEYPNAKIYASKECCDALSGSEKQMAQIFNSRPVNLDADHIENKFLDFEILQTPGHTDTDICIYNQYEKILFSGDLFFKESIGNIFEGGSREKMIKSLRKIQGLDIKTVYPGHLELGNSSSINTAIKAWNYFYKD